jgi:hypothetical protein
LIPQAAKWLLIAQDKVAQYRRAQRVSIFTMSFSELCARQNQKFDSLLQQEGGFTFDANILAKDTLSVGGMLRGIAFEYVGTGIRPLRLSVKPPEGVLRKPDGTESPVVLQYGRILPLTGALDIKPQFADLLWNSNPDGQWEIVCPDNLSSEGLQDIFMHFWVAY